MSGRSTAAGPLGQFMAMARGRLGRETIGVLFLRVGALALALAVAVVFARLMGSEGYGAYALAFAWAQILLLPAMLGMDTLMLREVAAMKELDPRRIRSYVSWSNKAVAVTALLTVAVGGSLVVALHAARRPEVVAPQLAALALVVLLSYSHLWEADIRALGRVLIGQVPEALLGPLLVLAGAAAVWAGPFDLTPAGAIGLRIVSLVTALFILATLLRRLLPEGTSERLAPSVSRGLIRSTFSLGFIGAVALIVTRTDVVMLGILSDLESVGSYNVAATGAGFVLFPLVGLSVVLAPTIAGAFAVGNRRRMQDVLTWGTRAAFGAAVPVSVGLFMAGGLYLDWFGEGFAGGLTPLRILVVGSLITSLAGFVGMVMTMTGNESVAARLGIGVAVGNLALNGLLIPPFGATGAAVATTISTNIGSAMLVVWMWRELRVDSTVAGLAPPGATDEFEKLES